MNGQKQQPHCPRQPRKQMDPLAIPKKILAAEPPNERSPRLCNPPGLRRLELFHYGRTRHGRVRGLRSLALMEHPDAEPKEPVCRDGDQGRELRIEAVAIEQDAAMRLFCLGEISYNPGPVHLCRRAPSREEQSLSCLQRYNLSIQSQSNLPSQTRSRKPSHLYAEYMISSATASSKICHRPLLPPHPSSAP